MWSLPGNVCIAEYVSVSERVSVAVSLSVSVSVSLNLFPASLLLFEKRKREERSTLQRQVPIFFVLHVKYICSAGG